MMLLAPLSVHDRSRASSLGPHNDYKTPLGYRFRSHDVYNPIWYEERRLKHTSHMYRPFSACRIRFKYAYYTYMIKLSHLKFVS